MYSLSLFSSFSPFFFFNDPATTEIYTLSLHDALPISKTVAEIQDQIRALAERHHIGILLTDHNVRDRKSTRLNFSHRTISYAVFCLKKKKKKKKNKKKKRTSRKDDKKYTESNRLTQLE